MNYELQPKLHHFLTIPSGLQNQKPPGGPLRNKELCIPVGFGTVGIRLTKACGKLMADRGYTPLATFR